MLNLQDIDYGRNVLPILPSGRQISPRYVDWFTDPVKYQVTLDLQRNGTDNVGLGMFRFTTIESVRRLGRVSSPVGEYNDLMAHSYAWHWFIAPNDVLEQAIINADMKVLFPYTHSCVYVGLTHFGLSGFVDTREGMSYVTDALRGFVQMICPDMRDHMYWRSYKRFFRYSEDDLSELAPIADRYGIEFPHGSLEEFGRWVFGTDAVNPGWDYHPVNSPPPAYAKTHWWLFQNSNVSPYYPELNKEGE